ncbi:4Fe-4S binding protein [Labilibacter marinus]|uniref:4Fe-4S binding protein n=1 Tax=Labilibacter marinus TaxID=1477105 RepID=UPI0009F97EC4|nr:4Fe-4S binding protein [Labilibacter marinus]
MNKFKQSLIAQKLEQELSIKEGIVRVDHSSCDGCESCVSVCPQDAIEIVLLSDKEVKQLPFKGRLKAMLKGKYKASINEGNCTSCGKCMKQCHEFAIHKVAISN